MTTDQKPSGSAGDALDSSQFQSKVGSSAGLCEAGIGHVLAGRYLDAQLCAEQALAADPAYADALHLMGLLCLRSGQYDHSVEWLILAIRQDPRPEYLSTLGSTLQQQGRYEEAIKTFDKAAQLKPDDAEIWRALGNVLAAAGRQAEAILALQHTLKLDRSNWDVADQCGILLRGLGRLEESLTFFSLSSQLTPDRAEARYRRGRTLSDLGRYEEALTDLERAHALAPNHVDTCCDLGILLQRFGRHSEALTLFDQALRLQADRVDALNNKAASLAWFHRFEEALALVERVQTLQPHCAPALFNKGLWLFELRRFDEAFAAFNQARTLDPDNAKREQNLSYTLLLMGDFEAGWKSLEARWKAKSGHNTSYPELSEPRWTGKEPVDGKTILVYADEGLGDAIQFARYIPMIAGLGANIILVVGEPVRSLLSNLPGVSQCLAKPMQTRPVFDYHCSISSLPLIFGTRLDTIPPAHYLPSPPAERVQAWGHRLGARQKLRVGLVWSGNPSHQNDRNRSIPLRHLDRLLDADASFVSLQKNPRLDDKAVLLEKTQIVDLTDDLTDFVETAALLNCLDLVIAVDTSVAHLAASLGRPTWILLPYTPDFRWLLDRDDSPWYPTARLFRQSATREYASVIERVRDELLARISAFGTES